ncbi:MAG: hypothetical protein EZS28_046916, partial [Streblomastix strix]
MGAVSGPIGAINPTA